MSRSTKKCPASQGGHTPITSPTYEGITADGTLTHTYCERCLTPLSGPQIEVIGSKPVNPLL